MRLLPLFILFLLSSSSFTISLHADGVYKWKDAYGNIQYGDKPPENVRLEQLDMPLLTVIEGYSDQWKSPKNKNKKPAFTQLTPQKITQASSIKYEKFAFIAPKLNQVIHTKEGDVSAMISIRPPLKKVHSITYTLDGKKGSKGASRITNFSGLSVGNHSLSASITDRQGKVIQTTETIKFRVIRFNSAQQAANKKRKKK